MSHLASGCVCWFRETEKKKKLDYSRIVGLEEYMLIHPTVVASILPNGYLWCYPMTSFAKQGIEHTTQNLTKDQMAFFAPVAPTKPHPDMPFRVELDRKLKTCGKSSCIDTIGCEDGCSFTCSYVNLEKPFKLPPETLSPFLRLRNGGFNAVRLSQKSREDIAGVLKQYLSIQKSSQTGVISSMPFELPKHEKARLGVHVKAAGPAHQSRNSNYSSPSAISLSDEATNIASEPYGKVDHLQPYGATHTPNAAPPKPQQNLANMNLAYSNKLHEELLALELREQTDVAALEELHLSRRTTLISEHQAKLKSLEAEYKAVKEQQAREEAEDLQRLEKEMKERKEKLVFRIEKLGKIEEFCATVQGLKESDLTEMALFLSDNLLGVAASLAMFRLISEVVDDLGIAELRGDKVKLREISHINPNEIQSLLIRIWNHGRRPK